MDIEEKIAHIEEEIRATPYHKGTEHHIGKLKARIAKLKEEKFQKSIKSASGGSRGFALRKSGDATVVLVGPPSVGKSTLINKITNTQSKVALYDFTTTSVIPGMMDYRGAKIQIFDIPGIISGAAKGKGRGKEVFSVVRDADLIIIMIDINSLEKINAIKDELYESGIRLDEEKPKISITKTLRGGVKIFSVCRQNHLSLNTIKEIAQEFRIRNGEILIKEDITLERLIDAFVGNRVHLPYLTVVSKVDLVPNIKQSDDFIFISAQKGFGIEELKKKIWGKLGLMRIYLKPKREEVDFNNPLITKKGKTLWEILEGVSLCDKEKFTRAKIYGPVAKFEGQEVSFSFQPQEGTIVSFWGG